MQEERVDVLIVGAGISGISAGYHLQTNCPAKSYVILEARDCIGGTWDLFRYPGIRSDSDMYTLGYSFRPWTSAKAIADGPSILDYVRDTAAEYDIDRKVRFNHRVVGAAWSSADSTWTVDVERGSSAEPVRYRCGFVFVCGGYYDYAAGYTPEFPGIDTFKGRVVHPQQWADDVDYAGKRVIVIGSGATAVTLVPELAKQAAHVTMLQRSPTYIVAAPAEDRLADALRKNVSPGVAYGVTRWKNVLFGMLFFWFCRRYPQRAKAFIVNGARRALGDDYPVERDFSPTYGPWDQRMCLVPEGDLFAAIRAKRASVVTDRIESFTESGLRLQAGATLDADLIVTATGLNLSVLSGIQLGVDGERVDLAQTMAYKGMMFSGVPNLAQSIGYTNASWTLKCDLTGKYVCRLLNHMARHGYTQCCPKQDDPELARAPMLDFSSGYVRRSIHLFPKQGPRAPWRLYQNYVLDILALGHGAIEDTAMSFSTPGQSVEQQAQTAN